MAKAVLVLALFAAGILGVERWNVHRQILDAQRQIVDAQRQIVDAQRQIVDLHDQVADLESQLKADEENETKDAYNIDLEAQSIIRNTTVMMALEEKLKPRHVETARALR